MCWTDVLSADIQVPEVQVVCLDDLDLAGIGLLLQPDIIMFIKGDVIRMRSRQDSRTLVDWLVAPKFRSCRLVPKSELIAVIAVENRALANLLACDLVVPRNHPLQSL